MNICKVLNLHLKPQRFGQLRNFHICNALKYENERRSYRQFDHSSLSRTIPALPTFYSSNPPHEYRIQRLESLIKKYAKYPTVQETIRFDQENGNMTINKRERPNWISIDQYKMIGGDTRLKPKQYENLIRLLNRLYQIDGQLSNLEIKEELNKYLHKPPLSFQAENLHQQKQLDKYGRALGISHRKTARAKVYVVRGSGEVLVNGRQLNQYFLKMKDRANILKPLQVTQTSGEFNLFILVSGGGLTGQSEAAMQAISKALLIWNPLLKPCLRQAGLMTRDYRHVERKKPGHKKARKMPTWVKR
ncbi:hypothetical protein TBLA_0F01130 [Henningerozyma blattae CBS 6284]|uniref:Small ribosomal subunit protein uS9m n=1 Tax=Henningerozyma blattae (strain ATCC 34711 / CBS 6284 / DSM 70876 / NBRC 10599 / NRRL Y-10934 / UCD 77-7) TaxID=1071380 RepID=I2H5K4_HENB6|nr:hypothetical protein TBLA_0F01130 [Tetrapisispora blattae CBS 6284]CCH61656.1 hypothetical protein TBLA_0F01130 [Tetrapisispora blattae CBS 6284]